MKRRVKRNLLHGHYFLGKRERNSLSFGDSDHPWRRGCQKNYEATQNFMTNDQ